MEKSPQRNEEIRVIQLTDRLAEKIDSSIQWAAQHLDPQMRSWIDKHLQVKKATINKIRETAERPVALGIFGASQCGKSYLVSELVKGASPSLTVFSSQIKGEPTLEDYLRKINPAGGKESTALVTRFTRRAYRQVQGCSMHVRLVTRTDLIKILMNGFIFECQESYTPQKAMLQELAKKLKGRTRDNPVFSEEEIWDLQDYVRRNLKDPYIGLLEELDFWKLLSEDLRFLPFENLLPALELLWGKLTPLTELFSKLWHALGSLSGQVVGISQDALIPRESSIIDVERLKELTRVGNVKCAIMTEDGKTAELEKPILCALARELILKVPEEQTSTLLDQMDVLDFPGARARERSFDAAKLKDTPLALPEVFLRGKVAYLFDRFSEDRDITGLVLCQQGGPQEAKSLPTMINKWVDWSHGADPKSRHGKPVTLFHVFSKFDEDLVYKTGADENAHWDGRLKTNFEEFFGRVDEWVTEWDESSAFRNCFWVRNPNVQQAVFAKNQEGKEQAINEPQLNESKSKYLANSFVAKHFRNPEEAWNMAATANNSGVAYLIDNIRKTIDPNSKVRQLEDNLNSIFNEVKASLAKFYIGDDITKARSLAEERAKQRLLALQKVMATHYALAFILDRERFTLSQKTIAMLYDEIINPIVEDSNTGNVEETAARKPDYEENIFAVVDEEPSNNNDVAEVKSEKSQVLTRGQEFAKLVLDRWDRQMVGLANDPEFQRFSGLDSEWFIDVAQELLKASTRFKLFDKIAEQSEVCLNLPNSSKFMRKQSSITAAMFNRFVLTLGCDRPNIALPVGAPKASLSTKSYPGMEIYKHWTNALKNLYKDNVTDGKQIDQESNAKLQKIISPLAVSA